MLIDDRPTITSPREFADVLAGAGRRRTYPRGSLVFAEGDEAHEVLIIRSGSVKVLVTAADGRQVVIDVFDPGALLGELATDGAVRRSATAVALTRLDVVAVPAAEFRRIVRDHEGAALALIDLLAGRLRTAAQRHVELGAADSVARVCARLDELADRYGVIDQRGDLLVDAPITQLDIAQWAGLSREAVVKSLRSLRSLGWVEIRGRTFVIRDRARAPPSRRPVGRTPPITRRGRRPGGARRPPARCAGRATTRRRACRRGGRTRPRHRLASRATLAATSVSSTMRSGWRSRVITGTARWVYRAVVSPMRTPHATLRSKRCSASRATAMRCSRVSSRKPETRPATASDRTSAAPSAPSSASTSGSASASTTVISSRSTVMVGSPPASQASGRRARNQAVIAAGDRSAGDVMMT